jgi:hypothetical protein
MIRNDGTGMTLDVRAGHRRRRRQRLGRGTWQRTLAMACMDDHKGRCCQVVVERPPCDQSDAVHDGADDDVCVFVFCTVRRTDR